MYSLDCEAASFCEGHCDCCNFYYCDRSGGKTKSHPTLFNKVNHASHERNTCTGQENDAC